jgi:hypothetical protein
MGSKLRPLHDSNRVFVIIRFTEQCQVFKVLLRELSSTRVSQFLDISLLQI